MSKLPRKFTLKKNGGEYVFQYDKEMGRYFIYIKNMSRGILSMVLPDMTEEDIIKNFQPEILQFIFNKDLKDVIEEE